MKYWFAETQSAAPVDGSMRDCCAKGSCVGFWIALIPQTKPSIKWEPDSRVGFSLMLLTILNPLLSLWTHPPSCAASGLRSPLGPLNDSDFYYLGWWDIHKETLCQQDGKHVSRSVLMCLLESSLKSNRASGIPLCSPRGHRLASSGWLWGMLGVSGSLMAAYYIGFLQQSHMNICACHFQWPTSGPRYHYRKLSGIRGCLWRYQQLGSTQWLPQGGESRLWYMWLCRRKVSGTVLCVAFFFFFLKCLRLWWWSENDGIRGN